MKRFICLILLGVFLVGCAKQEGLSEEEKLMQKFLQIAYTEKLETQLETPDKLEEYWGEFYESLSGLCTEEGYEKLVGGAQIADRALDALQNKYEREIREIRLDYDEKLQQASYTVLLGMSFEDGTTQTDEIKGIIGVQQSEDGSFKVHAFKEN